MHNNGHTCHVTMMVPKRFRSCHLALLTQFDSFAGNYLSLGKANINRRWGIRFQCPLSGLFWFARQWGSAWKSLLRTSMFTKIKQIPIAFANQNKLTNRHRGLGVPPSVNQADNITWWADSRAITTTLYQFKVIFVGYSHRCNIPQIIMHQHDWGTARTYVMFDQPKNSCPDKMNNWLCCWFRNPFLESGNEPLTCNYIDVWRKRIHFQSSAI